MWKNIAQFILLGISCYLVYKYRDASNGILLNIFVGLLFLSMIFIGSPMMKGKYKSAIMFIGTFLYSLIIMYLTFPLKFKFKLSDANYLIYCGTTATVCVYLIPKIAEYFKLSEKRVYFAVSFMVSAVISIFQVFLDSDVFKTVITSEDFFMSSIYKNYYQVYKIPKDLLDVIWKLIGIVFGLYLTILIEYKDDK